MMKKKLIKDIAMLYIYISRAVNEINLVFSIEMICVYTVSLIYEVTIAYYLLRVAMNSAEFFDWASLYLAMLVTLAFIIPTIISIGCSFYLITVFQNFSSYIVEYAWTTHNGSIDMTTQMQLLFELIKLRPIKVSCGFFDINLPLILSNIAVVGSYLVIICQFEITTQAATPNGK
ncbi:unnamed protein product [Chironomus riparius]|uniref:Gustatory receptor n=1 Tax=Chironomus riparius TaxID=315576 RepID=A0A9N9S1K1_9DIPT|nr:unnamed protein product [Chironomus riparius]